MNRLERDRYIAWVGYSSGDIQIWGQYERLFEFIFEEYPKTKRRFDEISLPTLFTLSHAIELGLKENIKFFKQYHESSILSKFKNWILLKKSHDLKSLSEELKSGYNKLHKKVKADKEEKEEFNRYFKSLKELISLLDRNSETYRYYYKIDNKGDTIKESIDRTKKIDFLEIKEHFDKVKTLLIGAPNSLGIYTDFIDFQKANPEYKKGKGYLYCQKLHYTEHFLENVKETLNERMTKISDDRWFDTKTGENFEIEIYKDEIYIIAV
ncbi:hypothetical protein [Psychroserpens sp. Hel_I_66]|uniref:hypothetical protein n=1 Tax=Psychroserpens sp. Hel_I_66 TaxID=1250004 RepID=UPI00064643E5|nr:hypothetical protein [Psychroserpens sp. Hel_I_66]